MSRIFRYGINKIYTFYNILLGIKSAGGSIIHYKSDFRCRRKISIGNRSIFYKNLSIYISKKGKFSMGADSHIAPYAYFLVENQSLTIGNDVAIGVFCSFFCSSVKPVAGNIPFHKIVGHDDIKVGNNVMIAAHCIILPGTVIEDNVFIAANSVVKGKLESGYLYGGSPCKPIKKLSKDD